MNPKRKIIFIIAAVTLFAISCIQTTSAIVPRTRQECPERSQAVEVVPTPTETTTRCTVAAEYLNIRTCGATSCGVVQVLKRGDLLTILEFGDWLKVKRENKKVVLTGYIKATFCTIGENK